MCKFKRSFRNYSVWLVLLFLTGSDACAQGVTRPEISAPHTGNPPLIDGDLSDKAWGQAVALGDFLLLGPGEKTFGAVKAKILRDNKWLYISVEIEVPDAPFMEQTVRDHDLQVCNDNSIEIFIDPGADGKDYLHYMLSAFNVKSERQLAGKGLSRDFSWGYPWRSATQRTDKGWQAEVAIPLNVIRDNGGLKNMAMNIGVNRIILDINHMGAINGSKKEFSSWALLNRGFHEPENFVLVRGMNDKDVEVPLLVSASAVKTGKYEIAEDGKFFYTVSGSVQAVTDTPGAVRVIVEDIPSAEAGATVSADVKIEKSGYYSFSVSVPVTAFAGRRAAFRLGDPDTGEILYSAELRDLTSLNLMSAFSRLSYYTIETEAVIICDVGLPEAEFGKMNLVVKDAAGSEVVRNRQVASRTFLAVPISTLPAGRHSVRVELQKDGRPLVSEAVELVKLLPKPGCEWKMDYHHMSVLDNGKLFFPFGVMFAEDAELENEYAFRDVAEMNFNMVIRWRRTNVEKANEIFRLAEKYNMKVFDFPGMWTPGSNAPAMPDEIRKDPDWKKAKAWSIANLHHLVVTNVMNEPLLMGWYLCDEPGSDPDLAEAIAGFNRKVYELDGYRPTEVLYIPPIPGGEFSKNCDIYGIDPYWVPGSGKGGSPMVVGRQTWIGRQRADRDGRILWVTPCAEYYSGTWMRFFNENEQRVQTYLSLINGAKGIIYFVYPFKNELTAGTFRKLGEEMKILGPACANAEPLQEISYSPPVDFANSVFPDVQFAVKQHPDGRCFLLGANWKPYPVDVICKSDMLAKTGSIHALFDGTSLAVKDGAFSVRLAPMTTCAYLMPASAKIPVPIKITVEQTPVHEQTDSFYVKAGRSKEAPPGKKNLIPNGSFEEADIPGSPNYIRYFYFYDSVKDTRVGDGAKDPPYILDTNVFYHGRQSLKMDLSKVRCLRIAVFPGADRGAAYTLSAWVRAGGKEKLFIDISGHKERFGVGEEWRKISAPITFPEHSPQWGDFMQFNLAQKKRDAPLYIWMDAVQLEKSESPTDYEE